MNKILIIVQRSNGDVFLSSPLIASLYAHYNHPKIDLLVNDDTLSVAKTLKYVENIYSYSYQWRTLPFTRRIKNEYTLIKTIFKQYDLSINLTASDRSVVYAILASSHSISSVEKSKKKSWWKTLFLGNNYIYNAHEPIVKNNIKSLKLLGITNNTIEVKSNYSLSSKKTLIQKLSKRNIDKFIIFHPSAQYDYKIYPKELRNKLLVLLNSLDVPIIVTGAQSDLDMRIKNELPNLKNVYDFIGETNLDEYLALSDIAQAYIGMDTLNMHIAASQNKRVFAIFGPTLLSIWSPWCHSLQINASMSMPKQTYGNITIFQADMPCVPCGLAGCDDRHGKSECLYEIKPQIIFEEVKNWIIK